LAALLAPESHAGIKLPFTDVAPPKNHGIFD